MLRPRCQPDGADVLTVVPWEACAGWDGVVGRGTDPAGVGYQAGVEMVHVSPHTKVTFRRVVLTVLTRDGSD